MKVFSTVEALTRAVGTHLGYSDWVTITQEQIDTFADVTGDHQWIHVDTQKAAHGPFGATIAHGFLTLSLVSALSWQVYRVDGLRMGINYGADRLRFPSPVRVDSRVCAGVVLLSVAAADAGYRVVARISVDIESEAKPACAVDAVSLLVWN